VLQALAMAVREPRESALAHSDREIESFASHCGGLPYTP
jgi:hypothetical protein